MGEYVLKEPEEGYAGDGGGRVEREPIPDGQIFEAELLALDEKPMKYKDGTPVLDKKTNEPVVTMNFKFKIVGGEFDDRFVWGETGTVFYRHPECRFHNWVQELFGTELPLDFRLDTESLQGNRCRIVVGYETYTRKDGTSGWKNFVKDVLRSKAAMSFDEPF